MQEYDTHQTPMHQNAPEKKLTAHNSVHDKHTEASQSRRINLSNLGQIFTIYAQEYSYVTIISG